jgi:hypothetical protein
VVAVVVAAAAVQLPLGRPVPTAAGPVAALVPVAQVGFPTDGPKVGHLMSGRAVSGTAFSVQDAFDATVFSGVLGASSGGWNRQYRCAYANTFSPLAAPGIDHLVVQASPPVTSPSFEVAPRSSLCRPVLDSPPSFCQDVRDGSDSMPSPLRSAPGHLDDERAMTYATPTMDSSGGRVPGRRRRPRGRAGHLPAGGGTVGVGPPRVG